jgi:exodeoxyribonuclease V gamma subunit
VGTTLPLDDVNGNCVELAGRFVVRRPRLLRVVEALQRPAALSDGIELLARVSDSNTWQSIQVQREVPDVLADADTRGDRLMRLPDVRALLARQIAGSPARANFGTGTLTVCAMTWCRRARYRSGWCAGRPRRRRLPAARRGRRRRRAGSRSADRRHRRGHRQDGDHLHRRKEYSGQSRPPAVPLVELLDALDLSTRRRRFAIEPSSNIRCDRATFATSPRARWACPVSRSPSTPLRSPPRSWPPAAACCV